MTKKPGDLLLRFLPVLVIFSLMTSPIVAQEKVCTVSDNDFAKAQSAFAKMADVFRNPRCLNCHGGVNPFTPNTKHAGGAYDISRDREGVPTSETFDQCQTCHGDVPGWQIPSSDMWFTGKDNVALCKLIKRNSGSGAGLMDHLTSDSPPLIEVGFKGTRGLNQLGRDQVKNYRAEPIQGVTHGQLIQSAREWLDALGTSGSSTDIITGDAESDCGCLQHHYAFEVHSEATINLQGMHWESGFGSAPRIRIVFDQGGAFHSDKTALTQSGAGQAEGCTMQGRSELSISVKGRVLGQDQKKVVATATGEVTHGEGSAQCPGLGSRSVSGVGQPKSYTLELDAIVGARSKPIPSLSGVQGGGGSTWIRLIQID